ncbi:MAG: hypothetical protein HWN67_22055 [Candidatus Helarchaeota archaeon]|nr:hypothetical protein [Candidatus Helarchaeota archaeon]
MKKKFTDENIKKIIRKELQKDEDEGMKLYQQLFNRKITEEEFNNKIKSTKGYNIWWGVESSWSLKNVKINSIKELEKGLFEISTTCTMERYSSHTFSPDEHALESIATIIIKVNDALKVREFNFKW